MRVALVVATMVLLSAPVRADFDITDFSATGVSLSYPSPPAGQANQAAVVGPLLQVTPGVISNRGAVWTTDAQSVASGFSTLFEFEFLTSPSGGGGGSSDGLAFVIQNSSLEAIGDHASAMGYGGFATSPDNGIDHSVAIELDDFFNSNWGDPDGNHVSVHTLGVDPNSQDEVLASIGTSSAIPQFGQGTGVHTVQINYESGELSVFVDDLLTPALVVTVDLAAVLESDSGWIGFTGSGGGAYQITNVLSWSFANGGAPPTGDTFRRGDVNLDMSFDISDAVFALAALFTPGAPVPPCADGADCNDDGGFDISDAVFALAALFTPGAPTLPAPGSAACGLDPTVDTLTCATACP